MSNPIIVHVHAEGFDFGGYVTVVHNPDLTYRIPLPANVEGGVVMLNLQARQMVTGGYLPDKELLDARQIVRIFPQDQDGRQWFEFELVPNERPLWKVIEQARQHGLAHPDHGTNCSCMDNLIREVKIHVYRGLHDIDAEWETNFDAQVRARVILRRVADSL